MGVVAACCPDLTRLVYTHPLHGGRLQQGMCDARLTHVTRLKGLKELKVIDYSAVLFGSVYRP